MTETPRIAVCAGSFDPPTNGHVDMIARAARLFDRVIVAVVANPSKQPWFTTDERMRLVLDVIKELPDAGNIDVDAFDGLLVDYVRGRRATAVVRGLRTSSEFSDESQMAVMNRHLYAGCETVFLVAAPGVAFISSRLVREIAALGGSLDGLVPSAVIAALDRRRTSSHTVRV